MRRTQSIPPTPLSSLILAAKESAVAVEDAIPQKFDLTVPEDQYSFERMLRTASPHFVHDRIADQLAEFLETTDPTLKLKDGARTARIREYLDGRSIETYGVWIYYAWSSRLVHVLPRDEYRAVRTARNRYKITQGEQDTLSRRRIGIVGLSVGNSAAITFALEGIGGSFKLADFDHLSLSNMNRLRSGAQGIGINKTVLAAREMYEIDPYLDIIQFPDGVTSANLDAFLMQGGKLDLLVEECDDLYLKIVIRERCRELGIPVIMDTSDRGLLDIERFDREPTRPLLHGLIGQVKAESVRGLPTKEKVPIFLSIVGGHSVSTRMAASLPEIDLSIGSWPQLASAVTLGGAITAEAARRLLLGQLQQSGRWYVDVEAIVSDGKGELMDALPPKASEELSPEALRPRSVGPAPIVDRTVSQEAIRWIVSNAILAPSPHNGQPWEFVWRNSTLECRHNPVHDLPSLDYEGSATWATFGAVAENVTIASRAIGLEAVLNFRPSLQDELLVCSVTFTPQVHLSNDLVDLIPKRTTNRRRGNHQAIDPDATTALVEAAELAGARLQLVSDAQRRCELGALMGACDRITYMNKIIHREVMSGFRWTREEVEQHRDGLDLATMELTESEKAGFWLLSKWEIVEALKSFGGGLALEDLAKKCVEVSSTIGLLTATGTSPADYFRGGRALQRMWLEATRRGFALQPWTGLPYLFARVERGAGVGLSGPEIEELRRLRVRYRAIFEVPDGSAEVLLFRLGFAGPPTAISLRRPLEQILKFM